MSYPYPQDRNRDRREKGEQPYKDAKEAMAQERAELQTEAERFGEQREQDQERDLARDAEERFAEINREIVEQREQ